MRFSADSIQRLGSTTGCMLALCSLQGMFAVLTTRPMTMHTFLTVAALLLAIAKSVPLIEPSPEGKPPTISETASKVSDLLTTVVIVMPTAYVLASMAQQLVLLDETESAINVPTMLENASRTLEAAPRIMDSRDVQSLALALDAVAQQIQANPNIPVDVRSMQRVTKHMSDINGNLDVISRSLSGGARLVSNVSQPSERAREVLSELQSDAQSVLPARRSPADRMLESFENSFENSFEKA